MFEGEEIWEEKPAWLRNLGRNSHIAISSRIRLARNLKGYPFPHQAQADRLDEIVAKVHESCGEMSAFHFWPMREFDTLQRQLLMEKRLISPEFVQRSDHGAVILDASGLTSVMINEEDHLRLQVLDSGMNLELLWEQIQELDRILNQKLQFSFSEEWGYLTACPTNTGTGLRISLLLHLPALELDGQLESVLGNTHSYQLAIRGFYGEGSDVIGSIYQISNKLTLGWTELKLMDDLLKIGLEIVDKEQKARERLLENREIEVEDRLFRTRGILTHARMLTSREFIEHYSNLLLGLDIGLISDIDRQQLNDLLLWIQPAHLQWRHGKELNATERDVIRAETVKTQLKL